MNPFRIAALLLMAAWAAGCVSKPVEEYAPPPLMIAQNSDGEVSLAWESEPGYVYTIYCQNAAGENWVTLEGAVRVPGTGGTLTASDRVDPNKPPRRYRLLPEKVR
jgi:hypothetical protein